MPTPIMPLGSGRSVFDDFSGEDIVEIARAQDEERRQRELFAQPATNETLEDMLNAAIFSEEDLSENMEQEINSAIEQGAQRSLEAARRIVNVPDQDAYSENSPSQLIDPNAYDSLYHRPQTMITAARKSDLKQVVAASDQQKAEEAKKVEEAKKNFDNPMTGLDV